MPALTTEAPAKINLTLRVLGRRPDGYHQLYSLTAFAGEADQLALEDGDALSLAVDGDTAEAAGPDDDNLVMRAARQLCARVPHLRAGAFFLTKRLPVAAGIGGGSSDAAAALRLLAQRNGLACDDPRLVDAAVATGADVRVCLSPRARIMTGLGDVVGPPLELPPLAAVLVNPRLAVPTPAVFRALAAPALDPAALSHAIDLTPAIADDDALRRFLVADGNDLEPAAMQLCPAIGAALDALRAQPGCWLARMSGSGATTFGLFDDARYATAAATWLQTAYPHYWVRATTLS